MVKSGAMILCVPVDSAQSVSKKVPDDFFFQSLASHSAYNMDKEAVSALITPYPDFPLPGILFQDVHPIMFNAQARKWVTDHLVARYKGIFPFPCFFNCFMILFIAPV